MSSSRAVRRRRTPAISRRDFSTRCARAIWARALGARNSTARSSKTMTRPCGGEAGSMPIACARHRNFRASSSRSIRRSVPTAMNAVRGLAHRLNQTTGRVYAYACDADLGDQRCGKDISSSLFTAQATVASVIDARRFSLSGIAGYANGWFSAGKLVFASGANSGRGMEIKRHAGQSVELWQAMSDAVAPGDAVTLIAGCDKQFSTCKAKFANAVNFRGFPYMPGNDAVLATPSAAQPRDGGSRYGN